MTSHELALNFEKTKLIKFELQRNNNSELDIYIANKKLPNVKEIKYLGIILTYNFKWDTHIAATCNKLRKTCYKIRQLNNILQMNYMRMVYFAIAQSVLEYGIIAWGGTYSKTISPLTNLQNKIVKLCLKKTRFYSTTQAFLDFDVMTTRQRYTVTLLNFVFRNLSKFALQATHRLTRRLLDRPLMVPLYRKTLCQKHANYLGPKCTIIWKVISKTC